MKKITLPLLFCICALLAVAADGDTPPGGLYQVSTLQALMQGQYEGSMTIGALKQHGDSGLGTFDALDGEMVVLDGVVYQVTVDGKVHIAKDDWTTPFANVAFLDTDAPTESSPLTVGGGLEQIEAKLLADLKARAGGALNRPWLIRIDGQFRKTKVRSVPRQEKPYPPLAEAAKQQQEYTRDNIGGTVIGFYFPGYMKGINVSGFHIHFMAKDKSYAGHVLQIGSLEGTLRARPLPAFAMTLPATMKDADLDKDMSQEIHEVERAR